MNPKINLNITTALIMVTVTNMCFGSELEGKVKDIRVRDDGLHWIYMEGTRTEKPACAANTGYFMIKDENSTYGKSQFSLLLSAKMADKEVKIIGTGECTRWGDGEDIKTILLK